MRDWKQSAPAQGVRGEMKMHLQCTPLATLKGHWHGLHHLSRFFVMTNLPPPLDSEQVGHSKSVILRVRLILARLVGSTGQPNN